MSEENQSDNEVENSSLSDIDNSLSNNDYDEFEDDYETDEITILLRDIIRTSTARSLVRDYSFYLHMLEDPLDRIMRESLDNLPSYYVKTNVEIKVESSKYNAIININKDTCCTICLCDFEEEDIVSKLVNCRHIFHTDCIKEWGYYKTTCPTCRTNI